MGGIDRRDFLKAASLAVGAATTVGASSDLLPDGQPRAAHPSGTVKLSGTAYTPVKDYPIRPQPCSQVRITDTFWKPKITTSAEVTIPFQIRKSAEAGRGLSGNVLEAAILSLAAHPDPRLEALVDARIRQLKDVGEPGNRGFEVVATHDKDFPRRVRAIRVI